MDAEILRDDRGTNTTATEPEAMKQFPPRPVASSSFASDNEVADDTEFGEPKVAYKVQSYISCDRKGGVAHEAHATAEISATKSAGMRAVFSNVPAFRQKLNNALVEKEEMRDRGRICDERALRKRGRGFGFFGRVRVRRGGVEG